MDFDPYIAAELDGEHYVEPAWRAGSAPHERYLQRDYILRRRFFALFMPGLDIFDYSGNQVLYCQPKPFRLREDVRIFDAPRNGREVMNIKSRSILDFSANYDVVDLEHDEWLGTLRRKGWRSLIRDHWEILDPQERIIATVEEDNMTLALLRRFLSELIPQSYDVKAADGSLLGEGVQFFNPFIYRIRFHIHKGPEHGGIDPRLMLAAAIMLSIIEGRQDSY